MPDSPTNPTASKSSTNSSLGVTRGSTSGPSGDDGDISSLGLQPQRGGDHRISHRRGLSLRSYPKDCPPLHVQWFFAVDVPKRKPKLLGGAPTENEETKVQPKKYAPFSKHDSKSIEAAFQQLMENDDNVDRGKLGQPGINDHGDIGASRNMNSGGDENDAPSTKVPVNEDFLFDVDIEKRELEPAYWLGPVYEVRRGSWFHQEGSVQRPADENLAHQLEEGYLKLAPWKFPAQRSASQPRSSSKPGARPKSLIEAAKPAASTPGSPKIPPADTDNDEAGKDNHIENRSRQLSDPFNRTHRLFGPYSNSVVTYQDATTAYILTDDFMSRMSSTVYGRFAGGSHFAGMKVTRGHVDTAKKVEVKDTKAESDKKDVKDEKEDRHLKVTAPDSGDDQQPMSASILSPASEEKRRTLERHMSSLVSSSTAQDAAQQEEEVRKRDEREIQDDYKDTEGDEQNRPIEHLLLVTHGIGQRLGLRLETVNFVHDVNSLRKTLKSVYSNSPDLQALNAEVDSLPKNCRVQVLPINWRHKLDFPKTSLKHNKKELDLGDVFEEDEYPNLENITVEGVPAVRGLITDLALDILLYQSPIYRDHITKIVVEECNRIYGLFSQRNPGFKGRISLVGHSLGSALMWDILCQQAPESSLSRSSVSRQKGSYNVQLDFKVEDFYALGSPIGLFQMLQGRTIAARKSLTKTAPLDEPNVDPFLDEPPTGRSGRTVEGVTASDMHVSAPKCKQVFNIFHPTDPISYRIEPLISPAMSTLKPQPLPYTKRGIFGANMGQGLSGIGTRVGQSVSGFWSSFSSGIASSLLNRSLGISADDESKMRAQASASKSSAPLGMSNANDAGSNTPPKDSKRPVSYGGDKTMTDLSQAIVRPGEDGEHPPTLIDTELETLYAGFQRRRKSVQSDGGRDLGQSAEWEEAERRARKLKQEELKVRALNSNGRVDYSIQEGAFDISLIAAVASHLSYWADEDVSHFIISQLLSRHRVLKRPNTS
ncbi:DDHD domain-containing protein [Elsinoe ampelina]|uniref:DDHD domain-containing protein n=1 Tax=Elsinoe ampelina TaxID=302913 RepID=A0A6A6GQP7_9PEZI|nr:DDHD domain-containing protein [Elsinoe ampelina]